MNDSPYEEDECKRLVKWMDKQKIMFTHLGQETFTRSWKQKRKNKEMGVRSGFPDYAIIIPSDKSRNDKTQLFFIEMKRRKGSYPTKEQKEWIQAINESGVDAYVCKGFDAAKDVITNYLKNKQP